MNVQPQQQVENGEVEVLGRAPTLYVIIAIKLLKGLILLLLGVGIYSLSDNNLPDEFAALLQFFHLDPSTKFFADLSVKLGNLTESKLIWVGWMTVVYSTFSLVEGTGLILRVSWAGWLAMAESVFFIPIEVYDLVQKFTVSIFVILVLNVAIVWYLFRNRHRLFHHHHHHHRRTPSAGAKPSPAPHSSAT